MPAADRPLSSDELTLIRWLLEHGRPGAADYLPQLARARVTPYTCPCGCGSLEFAVDDQPLRPDLGPMQVLADASTDAPPHRPRTLRLYARHGILAGLEVTFLIDPPSASGPPLPAVPLPAPADLRPL